MDLDEQLRDLLRQACRLYRQMLKARRAFECDCEFELKEQINQHIDQAFNLFRESAQRWRAPNGACAADFEAVYSACSTWLSTQYRNYPRRESVVSWIEEFCQSTYELDQVKKAIRQSVEESFEHLQEQGDIWKPECYDDWYCSQLCLRVQNRLCNMLLQRYGNKFDDRQVPQRYIEQNANNLLLQFFDELDQKLCILMHKAINSQDKKEKSKLRDQIFRTMEGSGNIWRPFSTHKPEHLQDYRDVVQKQWLNFFENLEDYDPSRSGVITYFNFRLEKMFCDLVKRRSSKIDIILGSSLDNENESDYYQALESIFGQSNEDDEDSFWEEILIDIKRWANEARSNLSSVHIQNPPMDCQHFILSFVDKFISLSKNSDFWTEDDNTPNRFWSLLAQDFDISDSSVLRRAWVNKCWPHIRRFLEDEGWL